MAVILRQALEQVRGVVIFAETIKRRESRRFLEVPQPPTGFGDFIEDKPVEPALKREVV